MFTLSLKAILFAQMLSALPQAKETSILRNNRYCAKAETFPSCKEKSTILKIFGHEKRSLR
jgi:hypothetical protein